VFFIAYFFLCLTSHFDIIPGIDITLPDMSEKGLDQPADAMNVALDKTGNCYVQKKKMSLKNLLSQS